MKLQFTPTMQARPWTTHAKTTLGYVGPDDHFVAVADVDGHGMMSADCENYAERLVACWNACEGSSTEWLEFQTNPDKVDQFGREPFETRYRTALQNGVRAMEQRDNLLKELKDLQRAYVNLLETGRDRILQHGGTCDPVDVMEVSDPFLRASKAAIAKAEGGAA